MGEEINSTEEKNSVQPSIPSDFQQYLYVIRYESLKYLRSRRLFAILIILAIVIGLILIVPPALGDEYPSNALDFSSRFVGFSSLLVILCITLFGADAIVSEFQHKTGYILFPNPLKRSIILLGKYTASFLSSMLVILIFYIVIFSSTAAITKSLPGEIVLSFLFCVMFLLSGLSVAYLLSSIMKGTTGVTVLTFFLFFLILPIIESVFTIAKVKPWASVNFCSGIILYILTVPYPKDTVQEIQLSENQTWELSIFYPDVALSLLVMLYYLVIAFAVAYVIFSRKEMK